MKLVLRPANRVLAQRLETERFVLQPLGTWAAIRMTLPWRMDAGIVDGLFSSPAPKSVAQWLRSAPIPNNVDRFCYAIVPKGAGAPIGVHAVRYRGPTTARNTVALADRSWWGKGVVIEVRARLMTHFFRHSSIERFAGSCSARNAASVFNYRRLGYDLVGTRHGAKTNPVTGEVLDFLDFEMPREKWLASPFAESGDGR